MSVELGEPLTSTGKAAPMRERLSSADVSLLYLDTPRTPQHLGTIAIFEQPPDGFDYERLVRLLEERLALVPRYRQKVRAVPGRLANPVWADDPHFDITYHVRRSALPRPGTEDALLDFCARIMARPLDRDRPLWEMYFVEGLEGGRVAIVAKTHNCVVDGERALHIGQVLLDDSPRARRTVGPVWMPHREPGSCELVLDATRELFARRPHALGEATRLGLHDALAAARWVGSVPGTLGTSVLSLVRPAPPSALRARPGRQRRLALARTSLADHRAVARAAGVSVNDVALATVTGALRGWLTARGEQLRPNRSIRALVPVSVQAETGGDSQDLSGEQLGTRVSPMLVDLPIGEPDPGRRLSRVHYAMAAHKASGRAVGAGTLVRLGGFAPPTLHALGARAAGGLMRRMSDILVANVPGPQQPRYAAGARMREIFPVLPLAQGQAVAIGLTSYNGGVYYGIDADRDAVPDAQLLARLAEQSLAELVQLGGRRGFARTAARSGAGRPPDPTLPGTPGPGRPVR